MTPKIIELIIEDGDDQGGLDGIALVEMPAHESNFEYFAKDNEKCSHYVLSDDEIPQVIQMFHAYGEPQGFLEKEGWYIDSIKPVNKKEFQILSNANEPSAQDTDEIRFRYKYVGPKDEKNRSFCAEMMKAGRVFRIEDIQEMSNRDVNSVGPSGYDIFEWRGSYNCRHKWVQLLYRKEGRIINSDKVERGVIDEDGMPGPDTRTTDTIAAGNTPPRTGFASNPDVSALPSYVDEVGGDLVKKPVLASLPLFENKEDAESLALVIGCKGSHTHNYGDKTLYMPCEKHPEEMAKLDEEMTFSVFNTEQKLVVGPAMVPDKMIIRRNEITGEIYYVYFTEETIKKLQQKFMQERLLNRTNIEHGRKFLSGVDVVESWIVDDQEKDKQQIFGMNYPKGTWMITMKVNDEDTWKKVKDGQLKGFSVQGYFMEKAKFSSVSNEILKEIKQILKDVR
jgi:hypothetical protein